jgi:hypothetical protein
MLSFKQFFKEDLIKEPGTQYGSNEGGVYKDTSGNKFYVKHYKNPDQAKVEALTGKLYSHMGIKTLNPEYKEINGKPSIVTPWNENLSSVSPREFEKVDRNQASQLGAMHAAATLTKNWDIVGLEHDNIMKHKNGDLYAIDHGGSFHFRAQGGPKEFGPDISERESLVNNSGASGHVFSHAFDNHPEAREAGINAVRNIDHDHVKKLFQNSGLDNWQDLHDNFKKRMSAFLGGEK